MEITENAVKKPELEETLVTSPSPIKAKDAFLKIEPSI